MEDILASIRRIIDEEDTRDARPASDLAVDPDEDGGEAGSLPVMAAAAVDRDDAPGERAETEEGDEGDAIFPERESLFWSRATGRGDGVGGEDAADDEAARDAESPRTDIFRRAQSKLGSLARPGARERIQSLSARAGERAEAREEDREDREDLADFTGASDFADADAQEDTTDAVAALADARNRDADDFATPHGSDILDLTNPLDTVETTGEEASGRFDGLSDDEDRMDMARSDARDTVSDEDRDRDEDRDEDARLYAPESLRGMADDTDDVFDLTTLAPEETPTVEEGSVESGASFHVSGAGEEADGQGSDARGSDVSEDDGQDIEDAISLNLGVEDDAPASDEAHRDAGPESDERRDAEHADEDHAGPETRVEEGSDEDRPDEDAVAAPLDALNTYSRFDTEPQASVTSLAGFAPDEEETRDEDAGIGYAAVTNEADEDEAPEETAHEGGTSENAAPETGYAAPADSDTADGAPAEYETDTVRERDGDERVDTAEAPAEDAAFGETAAPSTAPAASDAYAAAFMMMGDNPPVDGSADDAADGASDGPSGSVDGGEDDDLDRLDMGDELGFSDTFSASDVYHDDPPALDDDYSRSLDVEDEPVSAQGADHGDDDPQDDDGMEKVGGLVRDAMERDPVDYADPSALVSMTSEEISARALASLADVEGEAGRRMFGSLRISDDDGSESLEGMVRGMLRPLLREWLDDNLPNMVETAVRGEVERISAKSRKYSRAADKD